jgi:hypothetical protein
MLEGRPGAVHQCTIDFLTPFALIVAMTNLVHRLGVHTWLWPPPALTGWLNLGCTFWLLLRPGSTRVFACYLLSAVAEWFRVLPVMPNHFFFEGLRDISILMVLGAYAWRARGATIDRRRLFESFAPIVRAEIVLLYWIALLHKLNHDYLSPEVSCAIELHRGIAEVLPVIPAGTWTDTPVIVASIVFEGGIPLLLLFRRTAYVGIAAGVFFHGMLSLHPHYGVFSFSAMMLGSFCLFLSTESFAKLDAFWQNSRSRWERRMPQFGPKLLVAVVFAVTFGLQMGWGASRFEEATVRTLLTGLTRIGFWAWVPWGIWLGLGYGVAAYRAGRGRTGPRPGRLRLHAAWVVLLLLVVNGLSPYLGLKTVTVSSMFSNLRTESQPNHAFMPQWHVADLQRDTVVILWSSHQGSEEECRSIGSTLRCTHPGQRVPFFELKRWTSEHRGPDGEPLQVTFVRDGRVHHLSPDGDPALARSLYTPHPYWLKKLVGLRHVQQPTEAMRCKW